MKGDIIFTTDTAAAIDDAERRFAPDKILCLIPQSCGRELISHMGLTADYIFIDDAETSKCLAQLEKIWMEMLSRGFTRKSLLINIGGGVTTDMGGFAAACYMRGIEYINVPTTLLAMVDASAGGKTAVDFMGIKNIIGAFRLPYVTVIDPGFLESLPDEQLLSGFAEMLKHALLQSSAGLATMLRIDPLGLATEEWLPLIRGSVEYKRRIVSEDPYENGLRRILNLGHTAGHAFEALAMQRGTLVTHGAAVAQGIITALVLSVMCQEFPTQIMRQVSTYIINTFRAIPFGCNDYEYLLSIMHHDKKNKGTATVSFTLLSAPGQPIAGRELTDDEIKTALDITQDLLS